MYLLFNILMLYEIDHHNSKTSNLLKVKTVKFLVIANTQFVQLVYVYVADSPARCTNRNHGRIIYGKKYDNVLAIPQHNLFCV